MKNIAHTVKRYLFQIFAFTLCVLFYMAYKEIPTLVSNSSIILIVSVINTMLMIYFIIITLLSFIELVKHLSIKPVITLPKIKTAYKEIYSCYTYFKTKPSRHKLAVYRC